jgi:Zn-finger nucleic acid-binding protein
VPIDGWQAGSDGSDEHWHGRNFSVQFENNMATAPETMNCPACGAPVSSDATQCEHCGARLAMVACPSCFGMVFAGAKFCSHCGAAIARAEVAAPTKELCPRCQVDMEAVVIGKTNLRECPKCEGIWAETVALQQICADREQQSAVLGTAAPLPENDNPDLAVRYVPCPICGTLMNRVNFAHCSHVIVDVCRAHGTWFDKDELRRIVEFIRSGGLDIARANEVAELDQRERAMRAAQLAAPLDSPLLFRQEHYDRLGGGIASAAANLISSYFFD